MAVTIDRGEAAPKGVVADRNLYLDKTSTKLVAEGSAESAFQLINAGREVPQEEVDRLGLKLDADGKVVQDYPFKVSELRKKHDDLVAEKEASDAKIAAYKKENAVKDIPNGMEAHRVKLEARVEAARATLAEAIKNQALNPEPLTPKEQKAADKEEKAAAKKADKK